MGVQRTEMSPRTVSWSLCASSIHLWRQWWSLQTPGMKKWRVCFFSQDVGISWDFKLSNLRFEIQDPKWNSMDSKNWSHETSPTTKEFDGRSVEHLTDNLFKSLCCQRNHPLFKQSVELMEHLFWCNLSKRGDVTKCWGFFSLKI